MQECPVSAPRPIHTPIPEVIPIIKKDAMNGSGKRLFDNNPLQPSVPLSVRMKTNAGVIVSAAIKGEPVDFPPLKIEISVLLFKEHVHFTEKRNP